MLVDLCLGLNFSTGHAANMFKHFCADFSDRRFAIQNIACGEVQIAGHALKDIIV